MNSAPSIATLAVPAVISALAALAGVRLAAGLNRRSERRKAREACYDEVIRAARRVVYLLLTTESGTELPDVEAGRELVRAQADFALVASTSLRRTSARFVAACREFTRTMVDDSLEPRTSDLRRLLLSAPPRSTDERTADSQLLYEVLTKMVDVADSDLASRWWRGRSTINP